jgi:hypothetical protein
MRFAAQCIGESCGGCKPESGPAPTLNASGDTALDCDVEPQRISTSRACHGKAGEEHARGPRAARKGIMPKECIQFLCITLEAVFTLMPEKRITV